MAVDPDMLACLLLAAGHAAPSPPQRWATLARFITTLVADLPDTPEATGPRLDVVVTRRDTGQTVLRFNSETCDALLVHIRHQLDELTVAEFFDSWGLDPAILS